MQRSTIYSAQRGGTEITAFGVPTTFSADGEGLGSGLQVMRDLDALITRALDAAALDTSVLELQYSAAAADERRSGSPEPGRDAADDVALA